MSTSVLRGDPRSRGRRRSRLWIAAALVVVLVGAAFLVRATVVAPFRVPSSSMAPLLRPGDIVLVDRMRGGRATRGEVVVFDGRGYFADGPAGGGFFVKRVIGIGGDHVQCCDEQGRIELNGSPLAEPYLPAGMRPSAVAFDVRVPAGTMFVLGDDRADSADSRAYLGAPGGGMVPVDRVLGPVTTLVWPIAGNRKL